MPIPSGVSEVDYAGAMIQEPVELVKAVTNDLLVPTSAEFVIEGVMLPESVWMKARLGNSWDISMDLDALRLSFALRLYTSEESYSALLCFRWRPR